MRFFLSYLRLGQSDKYFEHKQLSEFLSDLDAWHTIFWKIPGSFQKIGGKVEKLQIVFFGQPEALLRPNEIYLKKSDWETDKLKLDPTFFSFFEIFEQNPAKWWVDHLNPTKTCGYMLK